MWHNRSTLLEYLHEVLGTFLRSDEDFFLTANILDQFSARKGGMTQKHYQLIGLTCMGIASKARENIKMPTERLVYCANDQYTRKQFVDMEITIFRDIGFSTSFPNPITFIKIFRPLITEDALIEHCSRLLCYIFIFSFEYFKYNPKLIASTTIFISKKIIKSQNQWDEIFVRNTGYREEELLQCEIDVINSIKRCKEIGGNPCLRFVKRIIKHHCKTADAFKSKLEEYINESSLFESNNEII